MLLKLAPFALAALFAVPLALAPPPGARVVTLTAKPGWFSEPSVAIDPHDPAHVLAAYQVGGYISYTRDAGHSWHRERVAPRSYHTFGGDVSVAYARGHAYLCYISFDKLGTESYWAHDARRNGIFVVRSFDGGIHWQKREIPVEARRGHPGIFEDKPYIVADDTNGPYGGNLYVGWTEFHLGYSQMQLSRSTDGGATWSRPIRISTEDGVPRDDNGDVEGFAGAVSAEGTLYVVWEDGTHIVFTASHDGGRTFAPSRPIIAMPAAYFGLNGFNGRGGNGFAQIGVDPHSGRLYVSWSDYRDGGIDVFTATSTNGGETWSAPVRVNTDHIHNGRDHFFQWMSVDPRTGDPYILFDDRRGDAANIKPAITLARSTNGGRSYANYAWTSKPFDPRGQFIGDYNAVAAYSGRVYGVWTQVAPLRANAPAALKARPHTIVDLGIAQF